MPKPTPPETVAAIRRLFRPGHGTALARTLGVSPAVVYRYADHGGRDVTDRKRGITAARRRDFGPATLEAGRLHASGMALSDVARVTGVLRDTANKRVRRYYALLGVTGWQRKGQRPAHRTASPSRPA